MKEAVILLDLEGQPFYTHLPPGRTGVRVPDTLSLWEVLWANKDRLSGVAHSHPGSGPEGLGPSYEDLTTFEPNEGALGRLDWWIANRDSLVLVRWVGPDPLDYGVLPVKQEPPWVHRLREISGFFGLPV